MHRLILCLLMGLTVVFLPQNLFAEDPAGPPGPPQAQPAGPNPEILFGRLDANHDGLITQDELPPGMPEMFKQLLFLADANGDGKISLAELTAALKQHRQSPEHDVKADSQLKIISLRYANAAETAKIIDQVYGNQKDIKLSITVDTRLNSLIVSAPQTLSDKIEALVKEFDVKTPDSNSPPIGPRFRGPEEQADQMPGPPFGRRSGGPEGQPGEMAGSPFGRADGKPGEMAGPLYIGRFAEPGVRPQYRGGPTFQGPTEPSGPKDIKSPDLRVFFLHGVTPEDILPNIRQLCDIPSDKNETADGSLKLSVDTEHKALLAYGNPEKLNRLDSILKVIDGPKAGADGPEGPIQVESYSVGTADPQLTLKVMQTLCKADMRMDIDPKTNHLIVLARPAQHATIRAVLDQMQHDARQVVVIRIRSIDPQLAVQSINKLFGGDDASKGGTSGSPQVDADPSTKQLMIRGTLAQIEQVKSLLQKMGETDAKEPVPAMPGPPFGGPGGGRGWMDGQGFGGPGNGPGLMGGPPFGRQGMGPGRMGGQGFGGPGNGPGRMSGPPFGRQGMGPGRMGGQGIGGPGMGPGRMVGQRFDGQESGPDQTPGPPFGGRGGQRGWMGGPPFGGPGNGPGRMGGPPFGRGGPGDGPPQMAGPNFQGPNPGSHWMGGSPFIEPGGRPWAGPGYGPPHRWAAFGPMQHRPWQQYGHWGPPNRPWQPSGQNWYQQLLSYNARPPRQGFNPKALFDRLDTNHDNQLSFEEFSQGMKHLLHAVLPGPGPQRARPVGWFGGQGFGPSAKDKP